MEGCCGLVRGSRGQAAVIQLRGQFEGGGTGLSLVTYNRRLTADGEENAEDASLLERWKVRQPSQRVP